MLACQQPLGNCTPVRQSRRDNASDVANPLQCTGAVSGAHQQSLALHHLRGHRNWGVAQVKAVEHATAALPQQQTGGFRPLLGLGTQFIEISERLNRFGTVVQRPGNRGRGTQDIDHDRCIRPIGGTNRVGDIRGRMKIGNLHGHTHRQRASQYRDHPR